MLCPVYHCAVEGSWFTRRRISIAHTDEERAKCLAISSFVRHAVSFNFGGLRGCPCGQSSDWIAGLRNDLLLSPSSFRRFWVSTSNRRCRKVVCGLLIQEQAPWRHQPGSTYGRLAPRSPFRDWQRKRRLHHVPWLCSRGMCTLLRSVSALFW